MREIKFRGKRLDNGEWVIGNLLTFGGRTSIVAEVAEISMQEYEVIPYTVGQFTGLLDKNGKKIYEGDVLKMWLEDVVEPEGGAFHEMWVVFTTEKGFILWGRNMTIGDAEPLHSTLEWEEGEIIGNIQDNPELVK